MNNINSAKPLHTLILQSRSKLILSGINEIINFSEEKICLFSDCGGLKIEGKNLVIDKADTENGDVEINGTVAAISYTDGKTPIPENFITKLFK